MLHHFPPHSTSQASPEVHFVTDDAENVSRTKQMIVSASCGRGEATINADTIPFHS